MQHNVFSIPSNARQAWLLKGYDHNFVYWRVTNVHCFAELVSDELDEISEEDLTVVVNDSRDAVLSKKKRTKEKLLADGVSGGQTGERRYERKLIKIKDGDCFDAYELKAVGRSSKLSRVAEGTESHGCHLCTFSTHKAERLKIHMRTHTGEKPYKCNICGHRTTESTNMRTHMRTHTKEKPYACEFCPYRSAQRNNLNRHVLTHGGVKLFECTVCKYRCIQSNDLRRHVRIHTGEKPYVCDQCDYTCIQAATLMGHKKHNHENTYTCSSCDFKCGQRRQMINHLRTHSNRRLYVCDVCEYKCFKLSELVRHQAHKSHGMASSKKTPLVILVD